MAKKSTIESVGIKGRPLRNDSGDVMNDYETAKACIECIDDYTKRTGELPKIQPQFVEWLRDGVKYVDEKRGSFVDYKNTHITKEYVDVYDQIIANTEKRNAELSKKGAFDSRIVQQIKGESK